MKTKNGAAADNEPIILPFRRVDHYDPPERDPEPDVPRDGFDSNKDEYWAGRIFAMRRSARVAA